VVRTGSRGLFWLEPMVEVETAQGRIAYGPVGAGDVPGLLGVLPTGGAHRLRLGRPEDIPYLARQTRLTFARCGIVDPLSLADYDTFILHSKKATDDRTATETRSTEPADHEPATGNDTDRGDGPQS